MSFETTPEFAPLFHSATELNELAYKMFDSLNTRNESPQILYKTTLLYFLNNVANQYQSITVLCREGYGQSSIVILRAILENLVSIKFMLLKDDDFTRNNLAKRFRLYEWIEKEKMLQYWESPHPSQEELKDHILQQRDEIKENVNLFKKEFACKDPRDLKTWSGVSFPEMTKAVKMTHDYQLIYSLCCKFSHPSFLGSNFLVTKDAINTTYSPGPSSKFIIDSLKNSIVYFHEFLEIFDHCFSLGYTNELKGYTIQTGQVFKQVRNQP